VEDWFGWELEVRAHTKERTMMVLTPAMVKGGCWIPGREGLLLDSKGFAIAGRARRSVARAMVSE
jgi:hypothetical protein